MGARQLVVSHCPPQVGHPNHFWNFIALGESPNAGISGLGELESALYPLAPPPPHPGQGACVPEPSPFTHHSSSLLPASLIFVDNYLQ